MRRLCPRDMECDITGTATSDAEVDCGAAHDVFLGVEGSGTGDSKFAKMAAAPEGSRSASPDGCVEGIR